MAIKKQEFYEGAALHLLARSGSIKDIQYDCPDFVLNNRVLVHLKYCTRNRSPWGFTFTPREQVLLERRVLAFDVVIGLVCGSDGVAAVDYDSYRRVAAPRSAALRVACYRDHGEQYEISGPDGKLDGKISPSTWRSILSGRGGR